MGLFENFVRFRVGNKPSDTSTLPITSKDQEIVEQLDSTDMSSINDINKFRTLANDRQAQYDAYDEMKSDSIIAAALELYADDATQYDEQGRIIWVESDSEVIADAGNRLLNILEIPERAWKHIYLACLYGDYYLKLYRGREGLEDEDLFSRPQTVRVVNDKVKVDNSEGRVKEPYEEYVEDVPDPSLLFDLKKRGKTAGFIEVNKEYYSQNVSVLTLGSPSFLLKDIDVYRPDRFVHIMIGETLSRTPEEVQIDFGNEKSVTYTVSRGKSILHDVYPIQKEVQLLEDSLLLNRLTRSSLIRLLEIELGDMPKSEVNSYLRRIKSIIEQHTSMDKDTGSYKSYNAPGPIDNVVYIPVRNGKGSVSVNNLGGDVNIRDIADIDYFNNKRAGALKVPRAYLGDDMDGSGLSNGGSLTRLSIRYARTVKRIQTSYIRAITSLLNLFFVDKGLDYVGKFEVRMTSPSTQEDLERNELINGNVDLVSSIMELVSSMEGDTQKKILNHLITNILRMPEIAKFIEEDETPEEDIDIDGSSGGGFVGGSSDFGFDEEPADDFSSVDTTSSSSTSDSGDSGTEGGFSDSDFAEFEDNI